MDSTIQNEALEVAIANQNHGGYAVELSDLQLTLVGGGMGECTF